MDTGLDLKKVGEYENEFITKLTRLISKLPKEKEAVGGIFAALVTCSVAVGMRAFGKEQLAEIMSLAVNRAITSLKDKINE